MSERNILCPTGFYVMQEECDMCNQCRPKPKPKEQEHDKRTNKND